MHFFPSEKSLKLQDIIFALAFYCIIFFLFYINNHKDLIDNKIIVGL